MTMFTFIFALLQPLVLYNVSTPIFPANTDSLDESLAFGEYLKNEIAAEDSLLIIGNPVYYVLSGRHPPDEFFGDGGVPYFDHWSYLFIFADKEGVDGFTSLVDDTEVDCLLIENYPWLVMTLDEIDDNTRFASLKDLVMEYDVVSEHNTTYAGLNYTGITLLRRRQST